MEGYVVKKQKNEHKKMYNELLRNHVYDWNYTVKSIETFIIRCNKTNTPYMRSFMWLCLITSTILISTFTTTRYLMWRTLYAVCYLHIKQIIISQEWRAIIMEKL